MKPIFEMIYDTVRAIPAGQVSTYGQIARLVGNPRLARVVGYALHEAPPDVPCHRVVNRFGGLSDAFVPTGRETHRLLLEMEGVGFTPEGNVNLAYFMWYGDQKEEL